MYYKSAVNLSLSWNFLAFVAEQVNLADPRAEDQDEFFFERRKLLLEAELQQVGTLARLDASDVAGWTLVMMLATP